MRLRNMAEDLFWSGVPEVKRDGDSIGPHLPWASGIHKGK